MPAVRRPAHAALAGLLAAALAACKPAIPPHRGPGPVPSGAADRAMARLAILALDLHQRIDPRLGQLGRRVFLEAWPQLEPAPARDLARIVRQLEAELARIDPRALTPPYRAEHALLALILERDRRLLAAGAHTPRRRAEAALFVGTRSSTGAIAGRLAQAPTSSVSAIGGPASTADFIAGLESSTVAPALASAYVSRAVLDAIGSLAGARGGSLADEARRELESFDAPRTEPGRALAAWIVAAEIKDAIDSGAIPAGSLAQQLRRGIVPPMLWRRPSLTPDGPPTAPRSGRRPL
jgi:hypothetical protein